MKAENKIKDFNLNDKVFFIYKNKILYGDICSIIWKSRNKYYIKINDCCKGKITHTIILLHVDRLYSSEKELFENESTKN
ncbi:MAG: hypothetical protein LH629_14070 [Ignavibacteria bacterium]|nr:hypothetical protein [Ignavibacteria bacterium]